MEIEYISLFIIQFDSWQLYFPSPLFIFTRSCYIFEVDDDDDDCGLLPCLFISLLSVIIIGSFVFKQFNSPTESTHEIFFFKRSYCIKT